MDVPCRPLTAIMRDAGYEYADFLSLDVQGAEYKVLQAAQPSAFGYIMTEVYGQGAAVAMARRPVQELLSNAGMVQLLPQQLWASLAARSTRSQAPRLCLFADQRTV